MQKNFMGLLVIFCVVSGCANKQIQGNTNTSSPSIQEAIETQRFVFKARTAMPARGRSVQLTSDYSLDVVKDTVTAYLPYFGRAYTAPSPNAEGGIRFTSTDFSYTVNNRKNGVSEILIKPNDAPEVQQLTLSLSPDGYGSLQVTSNNRQPITFNGYATKKQ